MNNPKTDRPIPYVWILAGASDTPDFVYPFILN
jgi:hypothetical protein